MKIKGMKFNTCFIYLLIFFISVSCEERESVDVVQQIIGKVQERYAPDTRVALFNIEAISDENGVLLRGESTLPEALQRLKVDLESSNIRYVDSIQVLPDTLALEGKVNGVIKISVANLRSAPKHSAELVSQATLGTPVSILQKKGSWYQVQTPDKYIAWVDYGGIAQKDSSSFEKWKVSDKIIFTETYGSSFAEPDSNSQSISDLVAGDILELEKEHEDFYEVLYPDDKRAFITKSSAKPYKLWLTSADPSAEALTETSIKFMGLPYLWGGTSTKGVDCSGFTKSVYFLNGMIIPRDASQQIRTGDLIDSVRNFDNLKVGDLLFFGKKATDTTSERVIHVGMWIGNKKFIHAMGDVHLSTFDSIDDNFDQYNYDRYLRTKRIANKQDSALIYLKDKSIYTAN